MISAAILCLALTVQREAGGEPAAAQAAVVHIIRNRVRATKRKTVCQVVRKPRQFQIAKRATRRTMKLVLRAWKSRDSTRGATHFHDTRIGPPYWAGKKTASFGKLRFYRVKR